MADGETSPDFAKKMSRSLSALVGPTHFPHYVSTYQSLFSTPATNKLKVSRGVT